MEVHPGMSFYNDVQNGTALVTQTLESANHLSPLHIPPGPPILPERFPSLAENSIEYVKYPQYKTPGALLVESRYRPFHPYVHGNINIRGAPSRNEDTSEPTNINGEVIGPGQQGSFRISQSTEESNQISVSGAPKSMSKPPELDISYRAANMLENVKKALWLSAYKRDYTGRGSMNPLLLDDYDAKIIGRATGELGKEVALRESFPSSTTQVKPLDGRMAYPIRDRQFYISEPQQQDSDVQGPLFLCTNNSIIPKYSEGQQSRGKMSASPFPQHYDTENKARKRTEDVIQNQVRPQSNDQGKTNQEKKLPWNRFRKITDTWKMEQLYQRQLDVPPDPEPSLKPADSIYYEDLQPSRLNNYIVWHHPVMLSKPSSSHLCFEKQADFPALQFASNLKDTTTSCTFPGWIPNCGVPRPQTKLLDIQDSFRKGEAIKCLNNLTKGGIRDLRDHDREGRRHRFQGINSYFFH
ncbi:hypothetical protein EYD10_15567 [Varanus komodoensis]|nr:hypothetical protein EYD10_15567 [Varanus komodoensis]